jgi:hypothetical protein
MRRSKYNFATLQIAETITVKGIDVQSVKNSLAGYNKRNDKTIVLSAPIEVNGRFIFQRLS